MADRKAVATGNWSALATWDGGASLPGAGDVVYANLFTVTIDQDITVGTITNAAGGTVAASAGGSFSVTGTRAVTANVTSGGGSAVCLVHSGAGGTTLTITGNVTAVGGTAVSLTGAGSTTINGNVTGGSSNAQYGIYEGTGGTNHALITVNGNVTGGSGASSHGIHELATNNTSITVTGVTSGGTNSSQGIYIINAGTNSVYTLGALTATAGCTAFAIGAGTTPTINQSGNLVMTGSANCANINAAAATMTFSGNCTVGNFSNHFFNTAGVGATFSYTAPGGAFNAAGNACGLLTQSNTGTVSTSITANVTAGNGQAALVYAGTSGGSVLVTGNLVGGSVAAAYGLSLSTNAAGCTVSVTGNLTAAGGSGLYTANCNFTSLQVGGNVTGGSVTNIRGADLSGGLTGTVTVVGTCTAGSTAATTGCHGVMSSSTGNHTLQTGAAGSAYGAAISCSGNNMTVGISGGTLTAGAGGCIISTGSGVTLNINSGNLVTAGGGTGVSATITSGALNFTGNVTATNGIGISVVAVAGSPGTLAITGSVVGGASVGVAINGPITTTVSGSVTGGNPGVGIVTQTVATGPVTINGAVTAGSGSNSYGVSMNIGASGSGLTVVGAVTGGSGAASYGINMGSYAIALTCNGVISGGSALTTAHGVFSSSTGFHNFTNGNITTTVYGSGIMLFGVGATYAVAAGAGAWSLPAGSSQTIFQSTGNNSSGTLAAHAVTNNGAGPAFTLGGAGASTSHTLSGDITGTSTGVGIASTVGASAVINYTGNIVTAQGSGITNTGTGTVNVVGNVTGGTAQSIYGASNSSSGALNITGNVTGGTGGNASYGVYNSAGGTVNVYGTAQGSNSASTAPGANNASTGAMFVQLAKSNDYPNGAATQPAFGTLANQSASCSITVDAMEDGSGGWPASSGRHFIRDAGTNFVKMRQSNAGAVTTMGEVANDYPAAANVRLGVTYDFSGMTGTCAVPAAGSVALGVAVDATNGTAALSPTALLGADLLTRLGTCATVETTGDQLAALGP